MTSAALGDSAAIVRELEVLADDSVAGGYSETVSRKAIAHILALRSLLSSVEDGEGIVREPVAYVVQSLPDGSIGNRIAVTAWTTFPAEREKLEQDTWVKAGCAKLAPLYSEARITQDAQEIAALKAELASVKAERDALKERIWQIRVELGALFTMLPNEVPGLAMEVCERDADRQCLFRAFELAAHKEGA